MSGRRPPRRGEPPDELGQASILAVGPDAELLDQVSDALGASSHWVDAVTSRDEVQERLDNGPPDVILLDLRQTEAFDGLKLCRALNGREELSIVPIVGLAPRRHETRLLALEAGASSVCGLPLRPEVLQAEVTAKLLDRQRCLRHIESQLSRAVDSHTRYVEYVVHDLKSPLVNILNSLRLLESDVRATGRQSLEAARAAAQRLQRMIMDVLDMGRIDAGRLVLNRIEVPLEDLVEEAVADTRSTASSRRVQLDVGLGAWAEQLVSVDFDLLTRVLVNLIENAIRFSPADGRVRIGANDHRDGCRLFIEDNGIGIPEHLREQVFERFAQVGDGTMPGSHGLGLAFCRMVAESHGFDIGFEARPRGSCFFLCFPGLTAAGG